MENNTQNTVELTRQSGRVCVTNLQRRYEGTPASETYVVNLNHQQDKMCLETAHHTHGSFITAGTTAYIIVKMLESLKTWMTGKFTTSDAKIDLVGTKADTILGYVSTLRSDLNSDFNPETITQAEIEAMWNDDIFQLNTSKLNINKLY